MPVPGSIKRITNPEDEGQFVDLRIVDELLIKHGSGGIFRRHRLKFLNHDPNSRNVKEERVFFNQGGETVDEEQYVDVEIINQWNHKHGSGGIYTKRNNRTIHEIDQGGRTTHTIKIHGKDEEGEDDPDVWIEVKRTDSFIIKHGQGGIFTRERIFVGWVEPEFDEATEGLEIIEGPGNGFDPPWRLDPLQEIVNVHWKDEDEENSFVFLLLVQRLATLDFQNSPRPGTGSIAFWRMPHNYQIVEGDWTHLTAFRYTWQSQQPINTGTIANPVWEDESQRHPIEWSTNPINEWAGLPNLPMTIVAGGVYAGVESGGLGSLALRWHPQAQWRQPEGDIVAGEDMVGPSDDIPFRRGTSVTIRMLGIASGQPDNMGLNPEGSPVPNPIPFGQFPAPEAYSVEFAEQTFNLSGVTITSPKGTVWKPVAVAVHQPTEVSPINQPHLGSTGTVYVLCKKSDDPEWFP